MAKRDRHSSFATWEADVQRGRALLKPKDFEYVGGGILADPLLELIAVSRARQHRAGSRQVAFVCGRYGLRSGDMQDLGIGLRGWRP